MMDGYDPIKHFYACSIFASNNGYFDKYLHDHLSAKLTPFIEQTKKSSQNDKTLSEAYYKKCVNVSIHIAFHPISTYLKIN